MRRVNDIQRRAEETQAQLKALRADVSSPDRSVTVTMALATSWYSFGASIAAFTGWDESYEEGQEELSQKK